MSSPTAPTITSVVVGDQTMSVYFTQGDLGDGSLTNYMYSLNGSEYVYASGLTSPIDISGLINGYNYNIRLIVITDATTANISVPSNLYENIIPYTTPSAPTITDISAGNYCAYVSFTEGNNGGYAISSYQYSIDSGVSFIDISATTSPITIPDLSAGETYTVMLKAVSSAPDLNVSVASNESSAVVPYEIALPPTISSVVAGDTTASIYFTEGSHLGGTIVKYIYSTNSTDYFDVSGTTSPLLITGLTNGTSYTFLLKAVVSTSAGEQTTLSSNSSSTVIPYETPKPPTITGVVVGLSSQHATIYFTEGSHVGSSIVAYKYSIDTGNNYLDVSGTSSPLTISGLTNGTSYTVSLKVITDAPENNVSVASAESSVFIPYTSPNPPIVSIDASNQALILNYADGGNGGYPVSKFQYIFDNSFSNNAVDLFPVSNPSSQFTVVDNVNLLRNGIYHITASSWYGSYSPYNLFDNNESTIWSADWSTSAHRYLNDGNGTYSGIVSTNVVGVGSVGGEWFQIEFPNQLVINTYSIGTYANFYERYPKEFYVLGSTDGTTWNVVDHRTNQSITNYSLKTYDAPLKTLLIKYMRFVFVSMTTGAQYSDDFNLSSFRINALPPQYTDLSANSSSVILSGLENTKQYTLRVREITTAPENNVSVDAYVSGTPVCSPDPPTFSVDGSNQKMIVHYNAPAFTGGYSIIKYLYNVDGGAWFEMTDTTGYYEITTIDGTNAPVNGTMYEIRMKSVSAHPLAEMATSIETSPVSIIPYTIPDNPTILNMYPVNLGVVVKYAPSTNSGGYPVSSYEYSTDGTNYITIPDTYNNDYTSAYIIGSWISSPPLPVIKTFFVNGLKVYVCSDTGMFKMATLTGIQKYTADPIDTIGASNWNSYTTVDTAGAYVVSLINPITLTGSPTLDTSIKQIGASSLYLNSSANQYMSLTSGFTMSATGYSMAFWVRPNIASLTDKVFLFETTGNYNNTNAVSIYLDTDGSLKMTTKPNETLNTYTLYNTNLNTATWTHIAITINKYKRLKTYINGQLATTVAPCSITLGSFQHTSVYIGKTGSSSTLYNGHIDDYRIYNGKVLSANEIALLYGYNGDVNFALNDDPDIIVYSTFDTHDNMFSVGGFTNGTQSTVYMRAKTNAPVYKYSLPDSSFAVPFSAPNVPTLSLFAGETFVDISFGEPVNTSGYTITKYQYSVEDGVLVDISLDGVKPHITNLVLGNKYDVFLHTVSNAPYNNISTASYKNIGTHITPLPPTITAIDCSNTTLLVHYSESSALGGYDLSGYQYSINDGTTWIDASLSSFLISGLTNGTSYTVIMRTITIAPDSNISLSSTGISAIPYTKPLPATIFNVDNSGTTLDVYYGQTATNGGYSIDHYEVSVDAGAYINIGTQMPYTIDATLFTIGSKHTIKIRSVSTAPLNNVSVDSAIWNTVYVGTSIPTPIITSADISNGTMNIYYTQDTYGVPTQKYICTEDEITYSEITEMATIGGLIPSPLDVDPTLLFYYTFDADSYNGLLVGNKASGTYVYDASMSTSGLISAGDKKYGTGSLQLSSTLKWVSLPAFDIGTNGYSISFWFKNNNSSIWARVFDFSPTLFAPSGQIANNTYYFCYYNSFGLGYGATNSGVFNPNINVNDNTWRHYVLTCSTTGYYTIYLNNSIIYQSQGVYPTVRQFLYNYIGKSTITGENYVINGGIDEFRLYKRELNASEVDQLYTYIPITDTRQTVMQYDLTSPLTITDLVNGRPYSFKIESVVDTSASVVVANSKFASRTTGWTTDGSNATILTNTLSSVRANVGIDASNALTITQQTSGSSILQQNVNLYGAGKYLLKITATAGLNYDASNQTVQLGIDGNYSTPFKMTSAWKNYIHLIDIPQSISTKQVQIKVNKYGETVISVNPAFMYLEPTPFSGSTTRSTGIAINNDETRALQSDNNGTIKFAVKTNGVWGAFQNISDTTSRAYRGVCMTGDGSRAVVVAGDATANYCYFTVWNGTTYGTLTKTLDNTARTYGGCAMSKDGSRLVVSVLIGYIYFATWDGSNYTAFTQTLDLTSRRYIGIACTADASRIVYGADSTAGYTFYADWNGTNYNSGTQTLNTTLLNSRGFAISDDKKFIYYTVQGNTTASLRYASWNGTNYSTYSTSSAVPVSLDGWALTLNNANNSLYFAPYGTTTTYKIKIPNGYTNNEGDAMGQLLALKSPWGIYCAEDYNATTGIIPEMRGYNLSATITGSGVGYSTVSGNGATASIPQITGTTATKITFPAGSIPTTFTICAITRYNGGTRGRVLQSTTGNWLHGHWAGAKNKVYYEGWKANSGGTTNLDNWLVICGKNSGSTPTNILADGVSIGSTTGGTGGGSYTLTINNATQGEISDFAFSHVFIWNQALTDSEMQTVSQSLLSYLQNGTSYKQYYLNGSSIGIANVSLSKAFTSPISNSTDTIIPYTSPLPPTITTADASNTTITVSYTDTTDNGGYSISKYQYRINGGSYIDVSVGTNTFTITGLTNGTSYTVEMRAISTAPANNYSSVSNSKTTIPYTRASPLTITTIDVGTNGTMAINFTTASTGGYSLVRYEYSLNAGAYTTASQMSSPLTITGLTNGTTYSVKIRQITGAPINPDSPESNEVSAIPFKTPLPPTITAIDASNQLAILKYTNTTDNGGYSVSKYQYAIDGGAYIDVSAGTNTVNISGLTNGTTYSIKMRTVSTAPFSNISVDTSPTSVIPYTRPSAPTITSIDASNTKVFVNFTEGYNGGYSLVRYEYSLNGGTYTTATGQTTSPLTISGLTNATVYAIKIRQITSAPTLSASPDSNTVSETPYINPSAPVITSVVPSNRTITINYTAPNANGRPITYYKYSLNNGALIDISTASPFVINGLANATDYSVKIYAVNLAGVSPASNAVVGTPFSVPTAPTITGAIPGDRTVTINYTAPTDNGGYVVQGYKYSLLDSSYTNFTITTAGEMVFNSLTNGTTYTLAIKAYNVKGDSPASNIITFTPNANPATPIINTIAPTLGGALVYYSNGIGSALITGYKYSLDGGDFIDASYNASAITVNGLVNSRLYHIMIRAYNPIFDSSNSNILPVYAGAPLIPHIVDVSAIGTTAYIHYTQTNNDSLPVEVYEVFSGGIKIWTQFASVGSPIVVPNMVSGRMYNIQIRAINQYGASYYSNMVQNVRFGLPPAKIGKITIVPSYSTVSVRVVSVDNKNFPITGYKYSLNSGALVSAGSSPIFTVGGLIKDTSYNIRVVATNEIGDSVYSDPVYFILTYAQIPDKPVISRLEMPDKNTLKIHINNPPVSITPVLYYKYALYRNGVVDTDFTATADASLPITITGLLPNTNYSAKIIAVNDAGDSPVSNTYATPVMSVYNVPNAPVLVGTRNINGEMYAIIKIGKTNGAPITNIKYSYNGGLTYVSSGTTDSGILLQNAPLNTRVSLRVILVNSAGESAPSKILTFTRVYTVPSRPNVRRVIPTANSASIYINLSNPNGSPILGYKYSLNGGAFVDIVGLTGSHIFTITGLNAKTKYTLNVMSTNALGNSPVGFVEFSTL